MASSSSMIRMKGASPSWPDPLLRGGRRVALLGQEPLDPGQQVLGFDRLVDVVVGPGQPLVLALEPEPRAGESRTAETKMIGVVFAAANFSVFRMAWQSE